MSVGTKVETSSSKMATGVDMGVWVFPKTGQTRWYLGEGEMIEHLFPHEGFTLVPAFCMNPGRLEDDHIAFRLAFWHRKHSTKEVRFCSPAVSQHHFRARDETQQQKCSEERRCYVCMWGGQCSFERGFVLCASTALKGMEELLDKKFWRKLENITEEVQNEESKIGEKTLVHLAGFQMLCS